MAARVDGAGGSLTRTAGMPSITSFTMCGWSYIVANQVGYLNALNNTSPNVDTIAGIVLNGANTFEVWSATGGGGTFNTGAAASGPAQGVWFFWWIQCSGSGANLLKAGWALRGATSFTVAQATLAATPTVTSIGLGVEAYADPTNVRFQDVKTWDAVLSTDELLSQMHRMAPVRWANLSGWYPMTANSVTNIGIDYSGNGRNLTTVATVTVEDPPPLSWGVPSVINIGASGPNAYTLVCAAGSFVLTGQAAGVRAARTLPAATGAFALTGQAAGLRKGYTLASATGAFVLTGKAAALRATRVLTAVVGAFTLTGVAANLRKGGNNIMAADTGVFTLTGQAASLRVARKLAAAVGTFTLSGRAAVLLRTRNLPAATGAFVLTGKAAALKATRRLVAATGVFAVIGNVASLLLGRLGLKGRTIAQTITLSGGVTSSTTITNLTGQDSERELP